jgi:hypothetical protein
VLAWHGLIGSSEGVGAYQAHIYILKIIPSVTEHYIIYKNYPSNNIIEDVA